MYIYVKFTFRKMVQQTINIGRGLCFLVTALILSIPLTAQVSEGGIPLSMDALISHEISTFVPIVSLPALDIDALKAEDRVNAANGSDLCRLGALIDANIDFQNSGSVVTLANGSKIWRMKIQVNGMLALGLYYDKFYLPQGVKYYLSNANGRQILGAYTNNENPDDGLWANEKIQGGTINMELDIDPDVDISQIQLHINKVGVFYKATQYLEQYALPTSGLRTTAGPGFPYKGSSDCEINAVCSTSVGTFVNQSNATVKIEYVKSGFIYGGTGTMMNNTNKDCRPFLLTASHVEPTNSTINSTYSTWVFYFNYQAPTCTYTGIQPGYKTMTGANFRSRASYNSSSTHIVGDFILLELKSAPPSTYGYYLSGWDTSDALINMTGAYICYHHPSGDIKKVSSGSTINPHGSFNGTIPPNTHWSIIWVKGGQEEGSSGSGLFNTAGRLIGILSGGNTSSTCTDTNSSGQIMAVAAEFSKLAFDWTYAYQTPSSAATRLKDWLDPIGSKVATLDGMTGCTTAIPVARNNRIGFDIYPNPAKGILYIELNSINTANTKIEVYNMLGTQLTDIHLQTDNANRYKIDISNYPAGVYLVRIIQDNTIISRKITLAR